MTEEQIKEQLSRHFVGALAHNMGVKCISAELDHGVDITFAPVAKRTFPNGKIRFYETGNKLDVQLKSTTNSSIKNDGVNVTYKLESKTFNDLVSRVGEPLPLHLILVVFDTSPPNCLALTQDNLKLSGKAYWYLPNKTDVFSQNSKTVTIQIPLANQLNENFLKTLYGNLGVQL